MATRTEIVLICDLDGKSPDGTATHQITLDGQGGEIELCPRDWARFLTIATRYTDRARRRPRSRAKRPRTTESRQHSQAIRDWARQSGIPVSDRGRIPAGVVAEYEASAG